VRPGTPPGRKGPASRAERRPWPRTKPKPQARKPHAHPGRRTAAGAPRCLLPTKKTKYASNQRGRPAPWGYRRPDTKRRARPQARPHRRPQGESEAACRGRASPSRALDIRMTQNKIRAPHRKVWHHVVTGKAGTHEAPPRDPGLGSGKGAATEPRVRRSSSPAA